MISLTILIPFPVSISICSSINSLWFSSLLLLCITIFFLFNRWWRCCLTTFHACWSSYLFMLYSNSAKHKLSTTKTEARSTLSHKLQNLETTTSFDEEKSTTKSSSGSSNLYLYDDVLVEVLCRLPPMQLFRCKIVSKSWNKFISDVCIPKITSPLYGLFLHTTTSSRVPGWDFAHLTGRADSRRSNNSSFAEYCFSILPFTLKHEYFVDSSNGLLLFRNQEVRCFYVCNPATKQCIALPITPKMSNTRAGSLMFDPHLSVVYMLRKPLRMLIYSSANREWKEHRGLHLEESVLAQRWSSRCVSLNGSLHTLSMSGHLLKFDTKQITATAIQLPDIVQGRSALGCIGMSKGHLHYAWTDEELCNIMVWMLNEREWVLKHTISILDFAKYRIPCTFAKYRMVTCAFHPTSDVIFLGNQVGIFCYHPDSKRLESMYKARSGTTIDSGEVLVFPFAQNFATLEDLIGSIKERVNGKDRFVPA